MEIAAESGLGTTLLGNLMVANRPLAIVEAMWRRAFIAQDHRPARESPRRRCAKSARCDAGCTSSRRASDRHSPRSFKRHSRSPWSDRRSTGALITARTRPNVVRRHLRHHTRLGVLDRLDRWQANDLLWCDEERRFVKVLCNCSRIEHLERLRVLPKGFKNAAVLVVPHIPSIRDNSGGHLRPASLAAHAYRPSTKCIAASVETCSFTL